MSLFNQEYNKKYQQERKEWKERMRKRHKPRRAKLWNKEKQKLFG